MSSPQQADSSGAPPSGVDTSGGVPRGDAERPATVGGRSANVADLLRDAAAHHPDRPALIARSVSRSWAALDRAADAGARRLTALGAAPGERVVISLPTGSDLALVLYAVARAGLIAVPTAPGADVAELADRVGAVASIGPQRDHRLGIALGAADVGQWWAADPAPFESVGGGEDLVMLARARGDRAVMLSHRAVRAAVGAIGQLGAVRVRDGDRVLQVLPLYHVAGWVVSLLPTALVGGAAVFPEVGFDVATVAVGVPGGTGSHAGQGRSATESALRAAAEHAVTVLPGAPGFFHHLTAVPDSAGALASVRLFTSGNAPLSAVDYEAFRERHGQPVWEGYGLSESASVVTTSLVTGAPVHGSVGRPLAGIELKVVGPDGQDVAAVVDEEPADQPDEQPDEPAREDPDRDPLDTVADAPDAGEVGRIKIRGATLFSGYWPNGRGGPDPDGWFTTGDIGFLDDGGELHLVDRAAEAVVVAGFTVYPREVEDVLAGHSDVAEVAVIGVPAADGHSELVAVLVGAEDRTPAVEELREFVGARLPAFKHPALYRVVDDLPKTELGRIDRDESRRRFGPAARQALRTLVAVPDVDHLDAVEEGDPAPDVRPEPAGDLVDLGARLPGTGDRAGRGRDDTDEDLF
ncbi:class I adenylate-forming enzyme family protein [Nakamurella sp.]|uniref:class I adenylate-forming enzyme family protein n=1 Tax=Nakamurella sp. TaxID=1869182 RepID=UPI0037844A70